MRKSPLLVNACLLAGLATMTAPAAATAKTVLKIATVAPRGTTWMRVLRKMKAKIAKETGGQVVLRIYGGQVQGDERDVVRKIRTGQLHGGSFTAIGLSMVNREALVMQMPLLFRSYRQIDRVRKAMKSDFERSFRKHGYVLLGWAEIGWIYIFAKNKISTIDQLRRQRVLVLADDPISKRLMRVLGIKPRPLGIPQVLPALNTGMVNVVYASPLSCLSMQWHSKLKYMTSTPLSLGVGATVVSKRTFDKLSAAHQRKVQLIAYKYHEYLIRKIRRDNAKARKALLAQGIKALPLTAKDKRTYVRAAAKVARKFVPRYYSRALLNKVRRLAR